MCRSALVVSLCALALGVHPAEVRAQLPVNPLTAVCLIKNCHEQKPRRGKVPLTSSCPLPATLVCAGAPLIAGATGDVGGAALGAAGDAVGAGIGAAGDAVMGGLTKWVAGGAAWLLERTAKALQRSTRPALGSTWFRRQYRSMIELSIGVALLFFLCAVLHATLKHDARALVRSALLAMPAAMLLSFAAVTLVEAALGATDWMTALVLRDFGRDTGAFFEDIGGILAPAAATGSPLPGFVVFLGGLLTALAEFVVWLELIMREAAVYVAVGFVPLSLAATIWERTAHWCRRLVEILGAIILSKLTIAVAVAMAAAAMGHGRSGEGGLTALMAGCAVMLIAALTPWILLRLIPMAEAAGHVGLHRGAARSAIGTAPGAQTAAMVVRQAVLVAATPGGLAASRQHMLAAKAPTPPSPPIPRTPTPSRTGGRS